MKEQIEKFLLSNDFEKDGETYTATREQVVGQMIINGVQKEQTKTIKLTFKYVGTSAEEIDGTWVDNRTHWQFLVDDTVQTEVLVKDLNEFKEMFKI